MSLTKSICSVVLGAYMAMSTSSKAEAKEDLSGDGFLIGAGAGMRIFGPSKGGEPNMQTVFFSARLGYRLDITSSTSASLESYTSFPINRAPVVEDLSVSLSYYWPLDFVYNRFMLEAGTGGTFTNRYLNYDSFELSVQPAFSFALGLECLWDGCPNIQFKIRAVYSPNHEIKKDSEDTWVYPTNVSNVQIVYGFRF